MQDKAVYTGIDRTWQRLRGQREPEEPAGGESFLTGGMCTNSITWTFSLGQHDFPCCSTLLRKPQVVSTLGAQTQPPRIKGFH